MKVHMKLLTITFKYDNTNTESITSGDLDGLEYLLTCFKEFGDSVTWSGESNIHSTNVTVQIHGGCGDRPVNVTMSEVAGLWRGVIDDVPLAQTNFSNFTYDGANDKKRIIITKLLMTDDNKNINDLDIEYFLGY